MISDLHYICRKFLCPPVAVKPIRNSLRGTLKHPPRRSSPFPA
jgi:hypothetical protein